MHHHPNLEQALLGLLLHDHPGLWSLDELARAMMPHRIEDAIAELHAAGLVHRCGDFVFATRAAAAAERIAA